MEQKNIEELMVEKGFTHEKLATVVGVSRPYVTNIIAGRRTPSMKIAKKLGDALGVSVDFFLPSDVPKSTIKNRPA